MKKLLMIKIKSKKQLKNKIYKIFFKNYQKI